MTKAPWSGGGGSISTCGVHDVGSYATLPPARDPAVYLQVEILSQSPSLLVR